MNAQAILSAEILVRFANAAEGNFKPNIVASDGTKFGVKPADFGRFQPGGRYRIEYTEREGKGQWQGHTFRDIVKADRLEPQVSGDARGARAPSPSQASGGEGVTPGACTEFEFVTRMLAAYVSCCGVENTVDGLVTRAKSLRAVYKAVWG